MGTQALTMQGADGRALPAVQPVANSVIGSPFAVAATAVASPELFGPGVMIYSTELIHIRISKDGTAADANDMLIPAGIIITFPIESGDFISMIQNTLAATVYMEVVKTVD